ncbi:MAG: fibronectin type III domain-containing protein, partial [Bacteroidales bacterium]|nr:fibronectin type III domain-containing protein [Bacteroidales bacterium]
MVNLYKKQAATTPCEQVSDVQTNPTSTSVTLNWTEPETVPENGYLVTLSAGSTAVVTDVVVAAGTTTYTNSDLTASTEYTYSIKSDCGEGSTSEAVTGTFTTPADAQTTLNVALSGTKEGDKFTGPVTFTFTTTHFTFNEDGKVKYSITGDNDAYTDVEDATTTESSLTITFPVGYYYAVFELVDMDGNALANAVRVEKDFTVKLPKAKAPEFSPATQSAAFTTAQTVTLTSATPEASILYSIINGEYSGYTDPIALDTTGTYIIKAFASKTGMENSDTITKTYKL